MQGKRDQSHVDSILRTKLLFMIQITHQEMTFKVDSWRVMAELGKWPGAGGHALFFQRTQVSSQHHCWVAHSCLKLQYQEIRYPFLVSGPSPHMQISTHTQSLSRRVELMKGIGPVGRGLALQAWETEFNFLNPRKTQVGTLHASNYSKAGGGERASGNLWASQPAVSREEQKRSCLKVKGEDQSLRLPCDLHTYRGTHTCTHTNTYIHIQKRVSLLSTIIRLKDNRWILYSANAVYLLCNGSCSVLSQLEPVMTDAALLAYSRATSSHRHWQEEKDLLTTGQQVEDGRLSPLFPLSGGGTIKLIQGFWGVCL